MKAEREAEHEAATSPVVCRTARRTPTGTKIDIGLREAPQAVFVVTRDQMDGQGIPTFSEALRCTSGVRAEEGADQCQQLVLACFPRARQTCLDGLRIRPDGYFGDFAEKPLALKRVEVLRGPAPVLCCQASGGCAVS
ncbi:TonB-dependent receptor plug domain-containing protein [Comamonas sp.]|uniref:TonB-dependent receptor plug domain-containing protein n=1 Tax=Comamonas sp. TaxID=34028 RepID=UPI0012FF0F18|nr:TonB-dependent receptor plug domain-containing protein [Comamonas sp.]